MTNIYSVMYQHGKLTKEASLVIKGFAIVMMIVHHAIIWNDTEIYGTLLLTPTIIKGIGSIGRLCVPLFVFVTGYGLMLKDIQIKHIPKRIYHLWIIYFICFLFVAIVMAILHQIPTLSMREILGDMTGLHRVFSYDYTGLLNVYWYITTAYILVIIGPMWVNLVKRYGVYVFVITLFLPTILHKKYDGLDPLLTWLPIYTIGMLIAHKRLKIPHFIEEHPNITFILAFICAISSYILCIKMKQGFMYIRMWLPVIFLIITILGVSRWKVIRKSLVWLGSLSFPMYCIHGLFLNQKCIMNTAKVWWGVPVFITIILSVFCAIIINGAVKKLTRH